MERCLSVEGEPTSCRNLQHLQGYQRKHGLQLLDEAQLFRSGTEEAVDLEHQLHHEGHVIALLLTHLREKLVSSTHM